MNSRALAGAVAAAAFLVFIPALFNAFVDWDDVVFLVKNSAYKGFGASNLAWMLTARMGGHYHPLTWLSYALDHALWGADPFGYHLTNVLLHAANAAAFFGLARRLLPSRAAAALAALLFAVHPLRVESVAWASERRDVLSALFYLLTVRDYLDGKKGRSLVFFACSLLSKAVGVTLPLALLILDWHQKKPLRLKDKTPYFVLAALAALVNAGTQSYNGALEGFAGYPLLHRLAASAYSLAFYVGKTLWPSDLVPIYEFPASLNPLEPRFVVSAVFVAAMAAAAARRRELLASWLFYVVTLLPVVGLVRFGPQLVADRYSYLSCLPLALLAGAAIHRRAFFLAPIVVLALATLTWRQCRVWKDTDAFWVYVLSKAPDTAIAHHNVGRRLDAQGRLPEAIAAYERALAIRPRYALAHNNLGLALMRLQKLDEAERHYRAALEIDENYWEARANLALALGSRGRYHDARVEIERAIALQPQRESLKRNRELIEAGIRGQDARRPRR